MKKLIIALFLLTFSIQVRAYVAIEVDVTKEWTDTGIDVAQDEMLIVLGYGRYLEADAPTDPGSWIGPEGYSSLTNESGYPLPEAAARCLIARIGNNRPFDVGSKYIKPAVATGRLYLGVNDINWGNNKGYLVAYIIKPSSSVEVVKVDITNENMTKTGLHIQLGDSILAIGFGVYLSGGYATDLTNWTSPGGYTRKSQSANIYPLPDARARCIMGKIGEKGNKFEVGDFKLIVAEQDTGELELGLNDINFSNTMGYAIFLLIKFEQNFETALSDVPLRSSQFQLLGNYPNPFNPQTKIRYKLEHPSVVNLKIFSITGQLVRTISSGRQTAGIHEIEWDGCNELGRATGSGMYLYQLEAAGQRISGKVTLAR